jgi:phospholipid-binding lipoprotein MlaA
MHRSAPRSTLAWTVVLLLGLLSGCASLPPGAKPDPADPWERMNRGTHRFNNAVDRAVLKPAATAYRDYVPRLVRVGIGNVLDNLDYPVTILNQFLQGKLVDGLKDTGRFVMNSTLGIGGLFDPASDAGLPKNDEDFGQTLGRWGVPSGPYLEIPFLGPSTVRDAPSRYLDSFNRQAELFNIDLGPLDDTTVEYVRIGLSALDTRVDLMNVDRVREQAYDEYVFVRDAWRQRREYSVRDGDVEEEPLEEFPDEEMPLEEEESADPAQQEPVGAETDEPNPSGATQPPEGESAPQPESEQKPPEAESPPDSPDEPPPQG